VSGVMVPLPWEGTLERQESAVSSEGGLVDDVIESVSL
jgi:hypothetical protein